jgi:hypothetical protein
MRLTSVVAREGITMAYALEGLRKHRNELDNARSAGPSDPLTIYQMWANEASRQLAFSFDADDVERLVMSRRHWALQSVFSSNVGDIRNMVQAEAEDRLRDFDRLIGEYERIQHRWTLSSATLVTPDTNIYLHQRQPFDVISWPHVVGSDQVCLIVPEITVRELDRQKTYGKNVPVVEGGEERVPGRARNTVKKLRQYLAGSGESGSIRPGLDVEFLANPLDHERLDDPDSEFIDRVLAMQRLTGHRIRVATADVGMELMARINGLEVVTL